MFWLFCCFIVSVCLVKNTAWALCSNAAGTSRPVRLATSVRLANSVWQMPRFYPGAHPNTNDQGMTAAEARAEIARQREEFQTRVLKQKAEAQRVKDLRRREAAAKVQATRVEATAEEARRRVERSVRAEEKKAELTSRVLRIHGAFSSNNFVVDNTAELMFQQAPTSPPSSRPHTAGYSQGASNFIVIGSPTRPLLPARDGLTPSGMSLTRLSNRDISPPQGSFR